MRFQPHPRCWFALLLSMALVAGGSFAQSSPQFTLNDLSWERGVKSTYEASLLSQPGVLGVGLAERNGAAVILVLVDQLGQQKLPSSLSGVNVVVEAADAAYFIDGGPSCSASGCHSDELPYPVPMGVSTSSEAHYNAGTLGFKACDPTTDTIGYVSNNHVAAGVPDGSNFFCFNGSPGLTQFHPGLFEVDPGCAFDPACYPPDPADFTNPVGTLSKVVDIVPPPGVNLIDAAFVASTDSQTSASILDIGVPATTPGTPTLNSCVRKSGRSSGLTHGRIDVIDLTWNNIYDDCLPGDPIFDELIAVVPDNSCGLCTGSIPCGEFAIGGDSGSALVDSSGAVVGLVFAREAGQGAPVFAATVDNVLTGLDLTLDLAQCAPNQPPVPVDDNWNVLWETPTAIYFLTLLSNDSDPENDPLTVCGLGQPKYGSLGPSAGLSITYTPPPGCEISQDQFEYTVCDGQGNQATAQVNLYIGGIICPSNS